MRRSLIILTLVLMGGIVAWAALNQWKGNRDWKTVERILGYPGEAQEDGFKVLVPRYDLNVLVHGLWVDSRAGLSSWFAFKPQPHGTLLVGEVVVVDWEAPKVEAELISRSFTLLAMYRPFNGENPGIERIRFMGNGSRVALAEGAKALLAATSMPAITTATYPALTQTAFSQPLEALLGRGVWQGGAFQWVYGPKAEEGVEIPSYMREQTTFNFQPDGKQTKVYGQWAVPLKDAGSLVVSLIKDQIVITATHSDLSDQSQAEVNFWAEGDSAKIAKSLARIVKEEKLVNLAPTPTPNQR